jgi:replicative DNA helicase
MIASCSPHNIEAEQALLGAILINNEALTVVDGLIEVEYFFEPIHQQIYGAAASLIRSGKVATPVTLKNYLSANLDIAGMSLNQYLARLCAEATTVINAPDYAKTIADLAHRRTMITIAAEIQAVATDSPIDLSPDMLALQAIDRLDEIVMARTETSVPRVSIGNAARQAVDQMWAVRARNGAIGGITTGLKTLDCKTDGLHRGEFVLFAGRPGMGKSALMESSARKTAAAGYNCLIFSLEMGSISLGARAISDLLYDSHNSVSYWEIARGILDDIRAQRVTDAAADLRHLPIVIDQQHR